MFKSEGDVEQDVHDVYKKLEMRDLKFCHRCYSGDLEHDAV